MNHSGGNEIPQQLEGKQVDITETIEASGHDEARQLFMEAKSRLFDVTNWGNISNGISAEFLLTDKWGKPKYGIPVPGDHFRIDIPGPGSVSGEGYDWVRVELVEDNNTPDNNSEWALIKVRPAEDPATREGVAHFFHDHATSSFIVKREGYIITAGVHGRNEKPNKDNKHLTDKIRNKVIGLFAVAGVATIQWKKLVNGLLNIK